MDLPSERRQLRVVADPDPGAVSRVVERFHNLNIVPNRIIAEHADDDLMYITVDVCGVPEEQLTAVVGKLLQSPSVVSALWHRLD